MALNTIEEIIEDIRQGKMVILMDDEDRENEGDLIIAAEKVTAADINFMARHACGLICLTLTSQRCEQLDLPLMVDRNGAQFSTNFTLSIEAAEGVTTGISAADRAHTVQVAVARNAKAADIVQPGHIFPLRAQPGGVLQRAGHTEAGCDLAWLAGFESASVIVEIMNDDGTMARRPDLEKFAEKHNLKIGTIADLIHYRVVNEATVRRGESYDLQTEQGCFRVTSFHDDVQGGTHLALVMGSPKPEQPTLVRVHQADTFRDLLDARLQDKNSWSLRKSLARIAEAGEGVVVLLDNTSAKPSLEVQLRHFLGLEREIRTSAKDGAGTYLTIGTGAQILRDVGVGKMRLLSSPLKFGALSGFDLEIVETLSVDDY
ncbi:bifunctional 3,4-dihydroxy-2-butanone-4-phosphate synthase/GTP cyclohydrolase II [Marinospirillum alkaliphilum]|uniref:3,4-dihydroxy-2-butanone 4-phosphate synthase n=1 Tax=Marinospirillum alkaliphilum DSM 21637 TaxID=1122209 RepID=A0A1K1V3N0_9GAMM|nr:bifunctional 3,4-dihydroxy-2-butanone-4-phosphate synthase/GTP cyclohydrolase II [Marinospirillum alkaliphilum]SFX19742.1 3,4-dihydroxy 2-butanone 4-phosphate synthase / GTP cyclohydrolase II [Marinospirillum alkaliphilum DSM 21637]